MKEIIISKISNRMKSNLMISILVAFSFILFSKTTLGQKNCETTISAEFNRNVKTISNSEFVYTLFLENSSTTTRNYSLSAENSNDKCTNPDRKPVDSNIILNSSILDSEFNIISDDIQLAPGESYNFFLKVEVPEGSPFNAWNCIQVIAESQGCMPATLVLHTYYPNPENIE